MDPATILLLLNSGLSIVEQLAPKVAELFASGDVSAEDQQKLAGRLAALRTNAAFSGPEWEVNP